MFPMVQLSILSEPHFASLSRMEADLALRLSPPIEDTDIVKKVGLMQFSLYAKNDYPYALDEERWEFVGYTERQGDFVSMAINFDPLLANRIDPQIGRASCRERVCQYV